MKPTSTLSVVSALAVVAGCGFFACKGSDDGGGVSSDAGDSATGDTPAGGAVQVQILAINDFHGSLQPPTGSGGLITAPLTDPVSDAGPDSGGKVDPDAGTATVPAGGAVFLAAHIKALRARNPNTVVVSAGDLTGASPLLSNLFKDEPTVLVMNTIGLDFEGVGNHDFDRGLTELQRLQSGGCSLGDCDAGLGNFAGAKFEYLAANVQSATTSATVFPPYAIKELAGAKIAFVGMTLEGTPGVTVATAVAGLSFKNEVQTVNALVPELRSKGADAIVVLLHQGGFQDSTGTYDSCANLTGDLLPILKGNADAGSPGLDPAIDVVVSAHTHQAYDCTIDGRLVTSAASFGRIVTAIDLTIDPATHKVTAKHAHNEPVTRDVTPDPDVAAIVAKYETESAPLAHKVVGWIASDVSSNPKTIGSVSCETPMGDVIADAMLEATRATDKGGATLALMNPGGVRADLVAKATGKDDGAVTYAEAFAVQPFSNNLVTLTLTGDQLQKILQAQFGGTSPKVLQVSSNVKYSYTYDAAAKAATIDLAGVLIDGVALDLAKGYRVTTNNFVAGGGDGFATFKAGTDRLSGMIDLDALVAYLGAKSSKATPLAPPTLGRITGNGCP